MVLLLAAVVDGCVVGCVVVHGEVVCIFFFQAEDGIRDRDVTGVQTCAFRSPASISDQICGLMISSKYLSIVTNNDIKVQCKRQNQQGV